MKAMVDHAHKLGLTAGWYGNNCICSDHNSTAKKYYEGDVKAHRKFGFDSWKLDGCGVQTDMQLWDDLIKGDGGKPVMVENCHWGSRVPFEPNATWCPWNFYRTSGDVRAKYSSVVGNLNTVTKFSSRNLSYPGCWAYPDMLEVGCQHGPGGAGDPGLTMAETKTHFAAWVIVSSPLTLSHDVNNDTIMDQVWPILSNKEVLEVSQTYAGFSGGPFKSSSSKVLLDRIQLAAVEKGMTDEEIAATGPMYAPSFQYLYKPLAANGAKTAVLMMNNGDAAADLTLDFKDIPGVTCTSCNVRDIWNHKDLGTAKDSFVAKSIASHDTAFLVITPGSQDTVIL
jgi:alpha-galactosidase